MLMVPGAGSYVVLGEILCNLPLAPDEPIEETCGDCDACRRACPTGAILADGLLDARRCRSFHTIENRGEIPRDLWARMGACVFGCDVCQAVCPHNANVPPGEVELLAPPGAAAPRLADLLRWSQDDWDRATRSSARRRANRTMWRRNAILAAGNSGNPLLRPALEALAGDDHAAEIRWAVERLSHAGD
jgi:epoxyqueuosine reductase